MHDGKYQCHMAAICKYRQPINYHLLVAQQAPYMRIFWEKSGNGPLTEKCQNRRARRTKQKNERR